MIDERTRERIMRAANVVDVIGDFYELRKSGQEWECLCPFHDDSRIGSFKVNERKNIFTCFSCGAHGDAVDFLSRHEGLTYPEAMAWLGKKYGIEVEGSARFAQVKRSTPREMRTSSLPVLEIPRAYMQARQKNDGNVLVEWMKRLPWSYDQRNRLEAMLRNYQMSTARDGRTIWWYVDDAGRVRTGKMMRYQSDGHRDKNVNPYWIHTALAKVGKYDAELYDVKPCLYGLHLIDFCPNAEINIVESEKTAVIMATAYGNMQRSLWMACGGMRNFNRERLKPVIERGRHIVVYPDRDGVEDWRNIAAGIGYDKLSVNDKPVKEWWTETDGLKADIADIVLRMMQDTKKKDANMEVGNTLGEMLDKSDALKSLVDDLGLIPMNA